MAAISRCQACVTLRRCDAALPPTAARWVQASEQVGAIHERSNKKVRGAGKGRSTTLLYRTTSSFVWPRPRLDSTRLGCHRSHEDDHHGDAMLLACAKKNSPNRKASGELPMVGYGRLSVRAWSAQSRDVPLLCVSPPRKGTGGEEAWAGSEARARTAEGSVRSIRSSEMAMRWGPNRMRPGARRIKSQDHHHHHHPRTFACPPAVWDSAQTCTHTHTRACMHRCSHRESPYRDRPCGRRLAGLLSVRPPPPPPPSSSSSSSSPSPPTIISLPACLPALLAWIDERGRETSGMMPGISSGMRAVTAHTLRCYRSQRGNIGRTDDEAAIASLLSPQVPDVPVAAPSERRRPGGSVTSEDLAPVPVYLSERMHPHLQVDAYSLSPLPHTPRYSIPQLHPCDGL
ncbi:uncharacterized protein PSFLO_02460 [Pseudozyma flocculosa]|uniref:Uncharacterized protein n=1 Tax=Pseudozyma flocculosa TaxID=84751 RepID=A0A5C3EXP1_9BASI|nr:uncharacterized protein PSFLO_02460 [Pseudozyma flocculosa]